MTYQLKRGEVVRDGKLYGWTGRACGVCDGYGELDDGRPDCPACAGTGDEHGLMPVQPADLPAPPASTEEEKRWAACREAKGQLAEVPIEIERLKRAASQSRENATAELNGTLHQQVWLEAEMLFDRAASLITQLAKLLAASPTPADAPTTEAELLAFIDAVERLAFEMQPPNVYTPRLVQMCMQARALLSATPTPADVQEGEVWQPIETAPKDEPIICCCEGYLPFEAEWEDSYGRFIAASGHDLGPTHWQPMPERMPLPAPPASTKDK